MLIKQRAALAIVSRYCDARWSVGIFTDVYYILCGVDSPPWRFFVNLGKLTASSAQGAAQRRHGCLEYVSNAADSSVNRSSCDTHYNSTTILH